MVKSLLLPSLILVSCAMTPLFGEDSPGYLLLYDFQSPGLSGYGWEDFTDSVMGGISEMTTVVMEEEGRRFLRMKGRVSLENNGGFIQTRMKLTEGRSPFDGGSYDGVRLLVRGRGEGYYLFFRTSATLFPWKYYAGEIPLGEEWREIDIPWSSVEKGDFGRLAEFDPSKLKSLALVAYGKEFDAQVDLMTIGLYKVNSSE